MRDLVNILFLGLSEASILALVTMGIVLIYKTSFTTNFAQGSIATVSAYSVTAILDLVIKKAFPGLPALLGVSITILIGITIGITFGVIIDTLIIRKSKILKLHF